MFDGSAMNKLLVSVLLTGVLCSYNTSAFSHGLVNELIDRQAQAIQINRDNAAQLTPEGPDAIGGIGDWFISNGILCAVVSDIGHESQFSINGGVLVDLGFCGRADDHFVSAHDLINGERERVLNVKSVKTLTGKDWASIITKADVDGATLETRYTLNQNEPTQLHISKRFEATRDDSDVSFVTPFWFNYHSMQPFVFSSKDAAQSKGFNNEGFFDRGISAITDTTINADMVILPSPDDDEQSIAYGWQIKSAKRTAGGETYSVPSFVMADDSSTIMLLMSDTFYLGDGSSIGWMQLPQIPLLSLAVGDSLELEEVIYVGKKADIASVTDQLLIEQPLITGKVSEIDSALHIDYLDGTAFTFVRPSVDGSFAFHAKPGEYHIRYRGTAGREVKQQITVYNDNLDIGLLSLPKPTLLSLPKGEPMRLVFVGIDDTQDPDFEDSLTDFSVSTDGDNRYESRVSQLFLSGTAEDQQKVALPAGNYRVYATRGPEYSLESTEIVVQEAKNQALNIKTPTHIIKTPGFISADLHVHSGLSFDNATSRKTRVKTFVAEHAEVMVSSEHDLPVDFSGAINEMGVQDKIVSIAATEMTSLLPTKTNPHTGGHVNFFPVKPEPYAYRKGMVAHENRRLRDVLHEFRTRNPDVIAQLNHARQNLKLSSELPDDYVELIDDAAFLDHMGVAGHPYNPETSLHSHPNNSLIEPHPVTGVRDLDVDAIEIINPGGIYHEQRIKALRKDWVSFIKQGHRMTGTANSDSHDTNNQVGVPRNMVAVSDDSIAAFDQLAFLASLKAGNAYGTTGPMLELSLVDDKSNVLMGQTFQGESAVLKLTVQNADWIPVEKIHIQINGEQVLQLAPNSDKQYQVPLTFTKDSFVTVEVVGEADEAYSAVYPGLSPYAFSNPIYIDADGDGKWSAPGL